MAARMAIMAITTNNSINVNARDFIFYVYQNAPHGTSPMGRNEIIVQLQYLVIMG
jgi:hypothetical protein